jgi:hypothetical protein
MIDTNFLNNHFKFYNNLKISIKFVKILGLCGGYIPPSTKNTNLDFYLNIRWKIGVSMTSPIPWS